MKKSAVIPSRADGEGPLSCKLRHHLMGAPTAGAKPLASLGLTCFAVRL
jgi:hypothetical protein